MTKRTKNHKQTGTGQDLYRFETAAASNERSREAATSTARRAYRSPQLQPLGRLLDVTMGSSPGAGESGNPIFDFSGT